MSKAQDKNLWITSKFDGRCACKTRYYAGDRVFWKPGTGILLCADCCAPELWPKFYGKQAEAPSAPASSLELLPRHDGRHAVRRKFQSLAGGSAALLALRLLWWHAFGWPRCGVCCARISQSRGPAIGWMQPVGAGAGL